MSFLLLLRLFLAEWNFNKFYIFFIFLIVK